MKRNAITFATCILLLEKVLGFHIVMTGNHKSSLCHSSAIHNNNNETNQYGHDDNDNNDDDKNNNQESETLIANNPKKYNQQLGSFKKLARINSNISEETTTNTQTQNNIERIVKLYDFSNSDPIKFTNMWSIQKELVDGHIQRLKVEFQKQIPESQFWTIHDINTTPTDTAVAGKKDDFDYIHPYERNIGRDAIIFLSHEPVYTLGSGSDKKFIKSLDNNIDVIRIERGGEVTYHGPGQLTVYPVIDLRGYSQDIHWYCRALEEAILISLKSIGITDAEREDDLTGVWVKGKKIAAIGVKVKRWCTMHGLAVNVDQRSISNFHGIVPCGLEGRDVCCINDFLDTPITLNEFSKHLKEALEEVFEVKII